MIIIFVASLNENMNLAKVLKEQVESLGKKSEIINLVELELPMYDSSKEQKDGIPNKVNLLIEKMEQAQGYIFVSPEYNFSLPPVLVNTIAWVSRVGDDFRKLFTLKPIQIATHSGGGGNDVSNAMRSQFTKLGSILLPRDIVVTYKKPINKESSHGVLSQFIEVTNSLEKK
jgi:NAD(P)H-dependent FMN reductase